MQQTNENTKWKHTVQKAHSPQSWVIHWSESAKYGGNLFEAFP